MSVGRLSPVGEADVAELDGEGYVFRCHSPEAVHSHYAPCYGAQPSVSYSVELRVASVAYTADRQFLSTPAHVFLSFPQKPPCKRRAKCPVHQALMLALFLLLLYPYLLFVVFMVRKKRHSDRGIPLANPIEFDGVRKKKGATL